MPNNAQPTNPAGIPVNNFFARVVQHVHKREAHADEARRRKVRKQESFTVDEAARLTGLSSKQIEEMLMHEALDSAPSWDDDWRVRSRDIRQLIARQSEEERTAEGCNYLSAFDDLRDVLDE